MSDNEANGRYFARLRQEHAELNDPRVRAQMQLDRWWQLQALAAVLELEGLE